MKFGLIGLNHHTANVATREKYTLSDEKLEALMQSAIDNGIGEIAILSTCGRFEIYYVSEKSKFKSHTDHILESLEIEDLSVFYQFEEDQALTHLFKVTCGLNSAVLGEDQILGQVKNALSIATDKGFAGKILNKLFREAISFSKRIKTDLKISETPLSLSYIAIKKAKETLAFNEETVITMVGLGKMGGLAIKYLFESSFKKIYVAVRHPESLPMEVLDHPKVRIVSFDDRYTYIAKSHLTVTSTGAPHSVIRHDMLDHTIEKAIIIDLAVPRDVDDVLYADESLTIWDVDALKGVSDENLQKRQDLVDQIESLMHDEVIACLKWVELTKVDDLLKFWHQHIDDIKQTALTTFERKMPSLDSESLKLINKVMESSLKQMIKSPLAELKKIDDTQKREQYVAILKELYNYE